MKSFLRSPRPFRRRLFAESLESRRLLAGVTGFENGDFETGDFSGWTTFVTDNGSIGDATVAPFDVAQNREVSQAAQFNVGERVWERQQEGGGIFQAFEASGRILVSAEIAADNIGHTSNRAAGIFTLLVDGVPVARHDFGSIASNGIETATLEGEITVQPGEHELRILMTRPFLRSPRLSPFQWVDNVMIESINRPPVAADDIGRTLEDATVTIDVTANDRDWENDLDRSSVSVVSGPANGTLVNHGDGRVSYTPAPDFHGVDSFVYEVFDGPGASDTATVSLFVAPQVDVADDVATVDEDHVVTIDVLANDDFADPTAAVTSVGDVVAPANGAVSIVDGQVVYTPNADFHGTDRFSYSVTTANASTSPNTETAVVEVTVNSVLDAAVQLRPSRNQPPSGRPTKVSLKSKGRIFAGIYSTASDPFDATTFDPAEATFTWNGSQAPPVRWSWEDLDGDGDDDLLVQFMTEDLTESLTDDSTSATLGIEFDGAADGPDLVGDAALR